MNVKHAFRNRGTIDQFLNLIVAAAATGFVMTAGQAVGYYFAGIEAASDPIEATERYGTLVMWVIHPIAALTGGVVLWMCGWRPAIAAIGVVFALVPLWAAWFAFAEFEAVRILQIPLYIGAALVPFVISRTSNVAKVDGG